MAKNNCTKVNVAALSDFLDLMISSSLRPNDSARIGRVEIAYQGRGKITLTTSTESKSYILPAWMTQKDDER